MKLFTGLSRMFFGKHNEVAAREHYDVALISDIRFPGGAGSSNAQEMRIQYEAGLRTALFHAPASKMEKAPASRIRKRRMRPSPKIQTCLDKGYADLLPFVAKVYAPLTIIRHPMVANWDRYLPRNLKTDRIVVVINHPATRADGAIDYELSTVIDNVRSALGKVPELCPISSVIADACRGPMSQHVELNGYWSNVFDTPSSPTLRTRSRANPITIGRHSRDSRDKWPENPETIREAYPAVEDIRISILGGAETPTSILGQLPPNWEVYEFNSIPVSRFLDSIDVYVYFHHSRWVEAFGRAPCEAIIAGVPTILPRTFEPVFGDACLYCEPGEVLSLVRRLERDPEWYSEIGRTGQAKMAERFGGECHLKRLRAAGVLSSKNTATTV